jgi:hypothetical protein
MAATELTLLMECLLRVFPVWLVVVVAFACVASIRQVSVLATVVAFPAPAEVAAITRRAFAVVTATVVTAIIPARFSLSIRASVRGGR